ncbi:MAG: hypothetical protein M9894_03280 [Planctomycetes bacterium]|nr:hypothetical protein [Planctomycetota bacterium]
MKDRDRDVGAMLEAVTWCETHKASVTWVGDYERLCRVEVLAPGSHWQVLRGQGATLPEAYRVCRSQFEAEAVRPAWRPAALLV